MEICDIENNRVLAIIRGVEGLKLLRLAEALYDGGVRLLEVAFNDNPLATCEGIAQLKKLMAGRMFIGAGTVTSVQQAEYAVNAGAEFILSPNTDAEVIKAVKARKVIAVAGAMSPSEAVTAINAGADYIKVFPAGVLGASFIKSMRGPFPEMKFIATAGVTIDNEKDFFAAGASAVGISHAFCDDKLIEKGKFDKITEIAAEYVKNAK